MEKLKALFGTDALTFEQLEEKLKDNKEVKLANLASGNYVDKAKLEKAENELTTANNTIKDLRETVSKYDGVDVEKLKNDVKDLENKYNTDIEAANVERLVMTELYAAKAKNPQMVKKMLDMSLVKRDGEKLIGFADQLEALKKSDGYAFDLEEPKGATVTTGGNHTGNNNTDNLMAALYKGAGLEMKGE